MNKPVSLVRSLTQWKQHEIEKFFKTSTRPCKHQGLDVRVAKSDGKIGRILVITPAKAGNAIQRNRFKRRIRMIFYAEKLFTHGFDWMVLVNNKGIELPFHELKSFLLCVAKNLPSPS